MPMHRRGPSALVCRPTSVRPAARFDKNTVFMMSDILCGQVDRFKGRAWLTSCSACCPGLSSSRCACLTRAPCGTGVMCSLSIPIITICALILLTIIVLLLELIFHWLPIFTVCFPLPGFKRKKPSLP